MSLASPVSSSRRYRFGTFDEPRSSSSTSANSAMNVNTDDQANNQPGATPAATSDSSKDTGGYRPGNKRATVWSWFTSQDLYLNNVGSVARDHLANERTFLAWLRTSLSLASIGVAITQLFRLSSSAFTLPGSDASPALPTSSSTANLPTYTQDELPDIVALLVAQVQQQTVELAALGTSTKGEQRKYGKLGKPVGGTFLMMGVVFLMLGAYRYLSVQHHLAAKNYFPPARRSILVASTCISALLVAAFTSILIIQ